MAIALGIDLGTQHLKVVFYDSELRRVVASESARLDLHQGDNGLAEQQAHWWVNALREALGRVDGKLRTSAAAIGVSGQQHGFVPLDHSGEVLAPVKLWCDTSTTAECQRIMAELGGESATLAETGNLILPGYTASKIRWFRNAHPALYRQMDCILLPHDYLNFHLTGERCMEMGDASGTGFLDVRTRTWSERALLAIDANRDLRQCLPTLRLENEAIGRLSAKVADRLGLPKGIPVSIGGGDNMMAAIGTGNTSVGKMTISLGTSGTVFAYSDQPIVDPQGNIAAFCSSTGGWLPLLCTMNCTVSTELLRRMLDSDIAGFEASISRAPPGSDGVLTVPFFNGERTPNLPGARGCVFGLNGRNTQPDNLLRSAVEGATFALRFGIDELAKLGIRAHEIVLTGGGAMSATWRQVVADVCDAPVTVLRQEEGGAFGAALQALAVLQATPAAALESLVKDHVRRDEARCCEPQPAAANSYTEVYREYSRAVATVAAMYS
jgi:xylulokinase